MNKKNSQPQSFRSSAAEYLSYAAALGDDASSIEMRYENENIWLTQMMIAELYAVSIPTINEHITRIYTDAELQEEATIRNFRIVQQESKRELAACCFTLSRWRR